MKTEQPKLKEIDITKLSRTGDGKIVVGLTYLCLIDGEFYTGKFSKGWEKGALDFSLRTHNIQFHPPGDNYSDFQKVWLIENAKEISKSERKAYATIRRKYAAEHGLTHSRVKCSLSDPLSHYYYFNDPAKTEPVSPKTNDWEEEYYD